MDIDKFKNLSLLDIVYSQLKKNVLTGKYRPGERLVVSDISKDLGVSHTPINASLNRLVMEGYVEFIPRKGMRVREIFIDDVIELFEIREMCELYCADTVVKKAKDDPEFLDELVAANVAISSGSFEKEIKDNFYSFYEREAKFHMLFVSASTNSKLVKMYSDLNATSMYYHKMSFDVRPFSQERYDQTLEEHNGIVTAIKEFSAGRLKKAIENHIEKSVEFIYTHLKE